MKDSIMIIVLCIGALVLGVWALGVGLDKQERNECAKWASQAEEFPNFFYADWQKEQCKINK